jgi:hypothetical protein
MADSYYTLQLALPCTLTAMANWWDEVTRVMGDARDGANNAGVQIVTHTDGRHRITIHLEEEVGE